MFLPILIAMPDTVRLPYTDSSVCLPALSVRATARDRPYEYVVSIKFFLNIIKEFLSRFVIEEK